MRMGGKEIIKGGIMLVISLLTVLVGIVWTANTYAQDEVDFAIIPKSEGLDGNEIKDIAKGGSVWDNYNKAAQRIGKGDTGTADQIQSGIMDWDTLLNYIVYLAQFIGELGLLIAAFVFIYIGYEKASKVFSFGEGFIGSVTKGLIVIIGAYFIVKFLYNAFMS